MIEELAQEDSSPRGAMRAGTGGALPAMDLAGTDRTSGMEEELKMELSKNDVSGLSQTSASIMNGKAGRQPVYRRPAGSSIRVRDIDCMLADIQAQIQMLRREMTYLGLVRGELAGGMEAK